MRKATNQPAFTLLELIVVMLIIATALAVAAPSLRGWSRGAKLRDETDNFLTVTRWARAQAVATATPYRLVVDGGNGRYWLVQRVGSTFVNFEGEFGQVFQLPAGYTIEMIQSQTVPAIAEEIAPAEGIIDFSPIGRTDVVQVQIVSDRGQTNLIACAAPHDTFRRVMQPEGVQ